MSFEGKEDVPELGPAPEIQEITPATEENEHVNEVIRDHVLNDLEEEETEIKRDTDTVDDDPPKVTYH